MANQNRRDFLKKSSIGMAGILAVPAWAQLQINKAPDMPKPELLQKNADEYWKEIRKQFSIKKPLIYLNNGTMGLSPIKVVEQVHLSMAEADDSGSYQGIEQATKSIARFVGADADEIALTHNVTEGINIACWGLNLMPGDEVIMTTHEHVGGCVPWLLRSEKEGILLRTLDLNNTPSANDVISGIEKLITPKTRVIAVPHIPCTQGQILPVADIVKLAKSHGIFTLFDGAHGPGMLKLNLHELGCDIYTSCCHKWMLGPKGTGFVYIRKDFLEYHSPIFIGAGGDKGWDMTTQPVQFKGIVDNAHRYFYGTQNHALFQGVTKAIEWMENIGMENIENRVRDLGSYTRKKLELIPEIEFLTPAEEKSRAAVNGFRLKGLTYQQVTEAAAKENIRIRGVAEAGLNSIRVSTHVYNQKEEIDALSEVLTQLAKSQSGK